MSGALGRCLGKLGSAGRGRQSPTAPPTEAFTCHTFHTMSPHVLAWLCLQNGARMVQMCCCYSPAHAYIYCRGTCGVVAWGDAEAGAELRDSATDAANPVAYSAEVRHQQFCFASTSLADMAHD